MTGGILFCGDPHGDWKPLLRTFAKEQPSAVVILGDCDLDRPLREAVAPVIEAGVPLHWIPGNHDRDTEATHDQLWGDYPQGNLHARWAHLDGLIVAGLGGLYMGRVWYPKAGDEKAVYDTSGALLKATPRSERWRGGLPLRYRDAILPEHHAALRKLRADVMVCHEAPSSHRHGFGALDDLARDMKVRLVVHGHHHTSYEGVTRDGIQVRGLGKAEPWMLTADMLP